MRMSGGSYVVLFGAFTLFRTQLHKFAVENVNNVLCLTTGYACDGCQHWPKGHADSLMVGPEAPVCVHVGRGSASRPPGGDRRVPS